MIIILSGPSGSGKMSVTERIALPRLVSWTTRPRNNRDKDGEYHYVTFEEFDAGWEAGHLLERNEHFGNQYGLALPEGNGTYIADIDVIGALKLMGRDDVIAVAITVPEPRIDMLKRRLESRGDENEREIESRLERALFEFEMIDKYWSHVVVNDDLAEAQRQFEAIVQQELQQRGV